MKQQYVFPKTIARFILGFLPAPVHPSHAGPGLHLRWRLGWLKALLYRAKFRIFGFLGGTKFSAGKRLSIQGRLRLRGPGRVIFGDDVIIDAATDIFTHSAEAVVEIGDGSFLNGTRFGVMRRVEIGRDAIVADARIMDTDFHSTSRNRHSKRAPVPVAPIRIGDNVWIAAGSAILKGVVIGDNSVVAFGSIVHREVPANTIVAGNPAKPLRPVLDHPIEMEKMLATSHHGAYI